MVLSKQISNKLVVMLPLSTTITSLQNLRVTQLSRPPPLQALHPCIGCGRPSCCKRLGAAIKAAWSLVMLQLCCAPIHPCSAPLRPQLEHRRRYSAAASCSHLSIAKMPHGPGPSELDNARLGCCSEAYDSLLPSQLDLAVMWRCVPALLRHDAAPLQRHTRLSLTPAAALLHVQFPAPQHRRDAALPHSAAPHHCCLG